MKIKCLVLIGFLFVSLVPEIKAERIERAEAENLAVSFMNERFQSFRQNAAADLSISEVIIRDFDDIAVYYAINFRNGGYVIISADDALKPVIGYAYEGAYSLDDRPCCFDHFMHVRAEEAAQIIKDNLPATPEIAEEWHALRNPVNTNIQPEMLTSVQPLVMSPWNQNYPYNALCPADPAGPGGHVYAGCVATAMAMVMYYYRYPEHGIGEKTHYSSYGPLYVNFGETYYNWDAMLNEVTTSSGNSIPAVAELQYHCGVAVNMSYSPNGSGAQGQTVPGAVYNYFGYNSTVNFTQRQSYNYTTWVTILKGQLDSGWPMYYQGFDPDGGHAWVCDGYEPQGSDTYFHMNWGWGGFGNGFFHLNNMNSGNGNFNSGHGIVRNFYPPSSSYPYYCSGEPHVITSNRGTLEDGSGPIHNYQNNKNCSWLIAPTDSVSAINLTFLKFDTQANDIVTVYDGDNTDSPVLGTYSGNSIPESITASGNKMLITFVTDHAGNAPGWFAEFTSTLPVFCQGMITTTEPTGVIDDGSGPYNYNHNSFCRWFLKPAFANNITISFNSFDLEDEKDYVQLIQLPENIVIGHFSGNTIPPAVTSTSNQVMVIFRSNNYYNAQGFNAEWTVDNVGISELEVFHDLTVYPNPASGILNMAFNTRQKQNVEVKIFDTQGREVYTETIGSLRGRYSRTIDIGAYPAGMYVLQVSSGDSVKTRKLIFE